jgi:hypothetical protein
MWPFSYSPAKLKPEVRGSNPPYLVYLDTSGNEVSKNDILQGNYGPLPTLDSLKGSMIYNTLKEQRGDPSEEAGRWTSKTWTDMEQSQRQLMSSQQTAFNPPLGEGLPRPGQLGPDGLRVPPPPNVPPPDRGGRKKKKSHRSSSVRRRT